MPAASTARARESFAAKCSASRYWRTASAPATAPKSSTAASATSATARLSRDRRCVAGARLDLAVAAFQQYSPCGVGKVLAQASRGTILEGSHAPLPHGDTASDCRRDRSRRAHHRIYDRVVGRLAGKSIVVTGGSSGLGRAMAVRFAREGAVVVVGDLREDPREGGVPTAELIAEAGGRGVFVRADGPRPPMSTCSCAPQSRAPDGST